MKILITSIVDLKKSQHQTFRKLDQNVQHFGWIRPHQFVKYLSKKHEVTVLSIKDWCKGNKS